jgi:hypothetical protein
MSKRRDRDDFVATPESAAPPGETVAGPAAFGPECAETGRRPTLTEPEMSQPEVSLVWASEPPFAAAGLQLRVELARGGSGTIYRAWDARDQREVAVKVLFSPDASDRFRRLIAKTGALPRLRHPNIVAIHQVGETKLGYFYVMDLIKGTRLDERVGADGALPRNQATALVRKLADAVVYAHSQGIIHGDLHPGNVLVDRSGEPTIVDFALGTSMADDDPPTVPGSLMGSLAYMAPERGGGDSRPAPADDIYGLGAILYFVLTGRPPLSGKTAAEVLLKLATQEPETPQKYSGEIDSYLALICLKCLKRDPAKRYASAADLAADLDAWLRVAPNSRPALTWRERVEIWVRRNPAISTLYALLVLLAGIGMGYAFGQRPSMLILALPALLFTIPTGGFLHIPPKRYIPAIRLLGRAGLGSGPIPG